MDYSTFYPHPYRPSKPRPLDQTNLQAPNGNVFPLNHSPPTTTQARPSQQSQSNPMSQLQQNLFYLDPFDTKVENAPFPLDVDHASFTSILSSFVIRNADVSG